MGAGFPKKSNKHANDVISNQFGTIHWFLNHCACIFNGFFPPDFLPDFQHQDMSLSEKTRLVWHRLLNVKHYMTYLFLSFFLQKPYKCEVLGCTKRYTDPSSLRKHVKSHSQEEQLQYRRSKDLANMAKRSTSPTARYSTWTPSSVTTSGTPGVTPGSNPGQGIQDQDSQHHHLLTSSSTLLQTGGTLLTVEDLSSEASPLQQHQVQQHHVHGVRQRNLFAHQQNSLDDLDNDTIPFDSVPVRYEDTTGKKWNFSSAFSFLHISN